MPHKPKTAAIITAAGQGRRMEQYFGGENKVFIPLKGRPILEHAVLAVAASKNIDRIIVAAAPGQESQVENLLSRLRLALPWAVATGGVERQHSIANALKLVPDRTDVILVHDGARPLAGTGLIDEIIEAALKYGAALPAVRVKDTIKESSPDEFTSKTLDRDILRSVQTPQAFKTDILFKAYEEAQSSDYLGTDDASLVERIGVKVKIIAGSYKNIKITTPEDIALAEFFLREIQEPYPLHPNMGHIRVGIGYDVHKFVTGRKLVLGGIDIDHTHGLKGHSDADVLLHAIKDALLGAAALGDIGVHFPDNDSKYKGISSITLLEKVRDILSQAGFKIVNVDATIVAQSPKLAPYIAGMNQNIANALNINISNVNVKATTTEGLGFAGRSEGIATYATASVIGCE